MSTDSMLGAAAPAAARAAAPSGGTWNVSVEIPLAPASVGLYMGLYDALSPAAPAAAPAALLAGAGNAADNAGQKTIKKPRYKTQLLEALANNNLELVHTIKMKMKKAEATKVLQKERVDRLLVAFDEDDVPKAMQVYDNGTSSKKPLRMGAKDNGKRTEGKKDNGKGKSPEMSEDNMGNHKAPYDEVWNAYNSGVGDGYQKAYAEAHIVIEKMESEMSEMREKIQHLEGGVIMCQICMERAPNVAFSRCGHTLCNICEKVLPSAPDGKHCHSCRVAVYENGHGLIKLFL
jgi:hypothetical protein